MTNIRYDPVQDWKYENITKLKNTLWNLLYLIWKIPSDIQSRIWAHISPLSYTCVIWANTFTIWQISAFNLFLTRLYHLWMMSKEKDWDWIQFQQIEPWNRKNAPIQRLANNLENFGGFWGWKLWHIALLWCAALARLCGAGERVFIRSGKVAEVFRMEIVFKSHFYEWR